MTPQLKDWLNLLLVAQKGPLQLDPAVRGQAYSHIIQVQGDMTGRALTGEVRSAPDADTALVAFIIGTPSYDGAYTNWTYSLNEGTGANSTGALPYDDTGTGVQYFPYDFLLVNEHGNEERLIGGVLPVSGHITEPV